MRSKHQLESFELAVNNVNIIYFDPGPLLGTKTRLEANSMELSPSREAASCATTEELPNIVWNPTFHYRVNKKPPLALSFCRVYPAHVALSYHSKIHLNIVYPPISWSS
jgi:hypothetical protein